MDINPSLYTDIGFNHIRKRLSSFANSEISKKHLLNIEPYSNQNEINKLFKKSDDLLKVLQAKEKIPVEQFDSIEQIFDFLKIEGRSLSIELFVKLYSILNMSYDCYNFLKQKVKNSWLEELNEFYLNSSALKKIKSIFDQNWKIRNSASKNLKKIRSDKNRLENNLEKVMITCYKKAKKNGLLHEENIQLFDNRKVLSVSASNKRKIKGAIYGQSQTGKAIYIEPIEVINIRNELQEIYFRESNEINRILLELTDVFRPDLDKIIKGYSALINLDKFAAKAYLAYEMDSIIPIFSDQINITNGKNPILLLQNKKIIDLNLIINQNNKCLMITGPNAGGKTVVLKTIGLYILMSQSGLHIPAEKVTLPIMNSIFSDIGDNQSIENDLSTFSAHLKRIKDLLNHSNHNSLVLIDELGTGTDPDAGAALAQSILENLIEKKVWTIATTHLGKLKLWAQEKKGILNSKMLFDNKKLEPLYEIKTGEPGSSFALEIAQRMGIPNKVLTRSKTLLGNKILRVETLLSELEQERREVKKIKLRLNHQRKYIKNVEEHIQSLEQRTKEEYKNVEQKALDEIHELILETRKDTEQLIEQIRSSQADESSVKIARQRLDQRLRYIGKRKKSVSKLDNNNNSKIQISKTPKIQIKKGTQVEIPQFGSIGTILQEPNKKGSILVEINGKQIRLDSAEIKPISNKKITKKKISSEKSFSINKPSSLQLDIRGKRVDEGITAVTQFLDGAVVSGLNTVNILHGTGTGALQEAVAILLKDLSYVQNFQYERPEAGGTGITIVNLK